MKSIKLTLIALITFLVFGNVSSAQELNSRKGPSFTLEIPGFGISHHPDQNDGDVSSIEAGLRFGYGLKDNLVVFLGSNLSIPYGVQDADAVGIVFSSIHLGAQYFVSTQVPIYITPKMGVAYVVVLNEDTNSVGDREGQGQIYGLGAGYEWRKGKSFAISPELHYDYYNVKGANATYYGILLNLQWY